MDINVGDRFYRVRPNHNRDATTDWIIVTKVGRKWAEFVSEERPESEWFGGRFNMETFAIDGGGFTSPGRIYRTVDDYTAATRANALWGQLNERLCRLYRRPEHFDEATIRAIAEMFKIDLPNPPLMSEEG